MKKNVLIVVLALIIVGGGGFIAGEKLGEKNAIPEATVLNTQAQAVGEDNAPESTGGVKEEIPGKAPEAISEGVSEEVTAQANKEDKKPEAPVTEEVKPTERTTESEAKVNKKPETVKTTDESVKKISRDEAKNTALGHAGLKAADVRDLEVELDFENGAYEYEVSFESGKYDYDDHIDAVSGRIRFSEKETDD